MKLDILYFASIREAIGLDREQRQIPVEVVTVGDLQAWLAGLGEPYATAFQPGRRIRAAFNQAMANSEQILEDGAEVAFFPPVTGG